jgi:hypothetical protein
MFDKVHVPVTPSLQGPLLLWSLSFKSNVPAVKVLPEEVSVSLKYATVPAPRSAETTAIIIQLAKIFLFII